LKESQFTYRDSQSWCLETQAHPVIELMNYHSFIEGASENRELGVPAEFGPGSTGGGQPGFAVVAMNTSGAFISPVAQVPLRIAS
jgi:hypothetical protein